MFYIFALLTMLTATPLGPQGKALFVVRFDLGPFKSIDSCLKVSTAPALLPTIVNLKDTVNQSLKPEYRDQFKLDMVCSDKSAQEIKDAINKSIGDQ